MKNILTDDKIEAVVGALIRLGSYATVATIGWKAANNWSDRAVAKENEIYEAKKQILDLEQSRLNMEIREEKYRIK